MKILKESKEILPASFLTNFVSEGWSKVGLLKDQLDAIKKEFKGTKKVEDLIQSLIDAYLVCIGQMEQHLAAKDYLDIDDKEDVKENLQEDVNINIEEVKIIEPEVEIESEKTDEIPAVNIPVDDIAIPEVEESEYALSNKELDTFEKAIMAAKPLMGQEDEDENKEKKSGSKNDSMVESCDWFCDFDQPVGQKITDEDLYPSNN